MEDVSITREYPIHAFEPGKIVEIVQNELKTYHANPDNISITGEFKYEDGIRERKELSAKEVLDCRETTQIGSLYINAQVFRISILRYSSQFVVSVFSDSRPIVLHFVNRLEQGLSLNSGTNGTNGIEEIKIADELIKELACVGKKLTKNTAKESERAHIDETCQEIYDDQPLIWRKVTGYIKERINKNSFDTWIDPLKLVFIDAENQKAVVRAVNDFARDWVETRYKPIFIEAMEWAGQGDKYQIYFVTDDGDLPDNQDMPRNISNKDVLQLIHCFLAASVQLSRPDALIPVETTALAKLFTQSPGVIGIGYADANIYQAAQQALNYPLFTNYPRRDMNYLVFTASNASLSLDEINSAMLYIRNEMQSDGALTFGAYVDEKMNNEVVVGIIGFEGIES